ncbi:MAG TPA: hypothetical protein VFX25_08815 [Streptosporangiaceae bacterium]|nr:hypothetical protein [Streptosporangiaceae bacterium]
MQYFRAARPDDHYDRASQLPGSTTRLVRLPGARHTIFRDRPDLAFPAVKTFVTQITQNHPAS